jgi:hypothetical protein
MKTKMMQPMSDAAPAAGEAEAPRLQRRPDGRLGVLRGEELTPVRPVRCFPWSRPGAYVSLRDDADEEVGFVVDPAALDAGSRAVLQEELAQAGFVLHIRRILSVREELEIRVWRVETEEGARTFQTSRDEWPRTLAEGSLRAAALDPTSRRVLWAFTD